MIISCTSCNKKFEINADLIPVKGRLLECGSCNNQWFFKKDNTATSSMKTNLNKNKEENISVKLSKNPSTELSKKNDEYIEIDDADTDKVYKKKLLRKISFLNIIIVFVISFIALVILMDTFKSQLSLIVPNIEFILYNLYESIKDIKLFFKDLI